MLSLPPIRFLRTLRPPFPLRAFSTRSPHPPSFAFDIDGVLLRGRSLIPSAHAALHHLFDRDLQTWRAPVAFLTNGGGHTEGTRAKILSSLFDVPVDPRQIILAHTPMRALAPTYRNSNTLVVTVGPEGCADAARAYGFPHVLSAERLAKVRPEATPFANMDGMAEVTEEEMELAGMSVGAVFVMADSRDWGRDAQLLVDILASDGSAMRTRSEEQVVDMFFSNPDITFPNEYGMPRLAGGAFRVALEAVFEKVTGRRLKSMQFGKPFSPNYQVAEEVLNAEKARLGFVGAGELGTVYAIGDNPKSDIRGANKWGKGWVSVLVRTGNFQGAMDNDATDPAMVVCDNVYDAVKLGMRESGIEDGQVHGDA